MPPLGFSAGELIERRDVSDTLAVFRFRLAEPLRFTAGQYTTIGLECEGEFLERPYSIVSSPYDHLWSFSLSSFPAELLRHKFGTLD